MPVNKGSSLQDCETELKWKQLTAANRSSPRSCLQLMFGRMPESGFVQVSVLLAGTSGKRSCLLVEILASVPSPKTHG